MADSIHFVEANGLRFAYLEEGSGPLVLMLHGFPDTAHTWDDLRPRIAADGYRAVSPFMRGYHPSAIPDRDTDQETLARDPLALIEALGARDAVVIGHDWGASAAYGAAALGPEQVKKLFVIGIPHPAALKPSLKKLWGVRHFAAYKLPGAPDRFARNDFAALPAIYRRWSPTWSPDPTAFAAVRACFSNRASLNAAFGYYRKLSPIPSASLRARITVPVVAFAGLDDPIVEPSDYRGAARMFENEYIVEEVRGGHFMHREHPDAFAERLLTHLG
jgi:pimeloyl-ACP methyl ester carboxylesterase